MTYRRYTSTVAGPGVVDVWRPPASGQVPTALLLGRAPAGWRTVAPSLNPLHLVEEGFAVVCVDLTGWGNQANLDSIDAALDHAAGFDADTDRVLLVAHGANTTAGKTAGPAALNWALRHIDQVAAVSLQSCVIDLAAHYTATPADQAAIDAAYGGSFTAVAATWNPGHRHRYEMAVHLFDEHLTGVNRVSVWWADDDPVTPSATTADIAAKMHAVIGGLTTFDPAAAVPATILDQSITQARDWVAQRPAFTRMKAWRDYIDVSTNNLAYKSGDITAVTILADGRELAMFGDHGIGTVDADGTFGPTVLPRHNAFILIDNGVYAQAYGPANATPLQPDPVYGAGMIYSGPLGYTFENGAHQFMCWRARPEPAGFYSYHDTHVVAVDPTDLDSDLVTITDEVPLGLPEAFMPTGLLVDGSWVWILVREWQCTSAVTSGSCYEQFFLDWPDNADRVVNRLARCPTGSLRDINQWRWWDGGSFQADRTQAVLLTDSSGQPIVDEIAMRRTRSGFVLAAMGLTDRQIRLYRSGWPQGPWTLYHTVPALNGLVRMGSLNIGFLPVFLPHLDPSTTELMLAWGANQVIDGGIPITDHDPDWYRPHHVVVPAPPFTP